MRQVIARIRRSIVLSALVTGLLFAPLGVLIHPASAAATTCDNVNVIYCGVGDVASFKAIYASNESGHSNSPSLKKDYTDLHIIYTAQGITASDVASMNTSNSVPGTLYKDGHITVSGATVATNAKISARFSVPGAIHISGTNAYIRSVTSSFANPSQTVFVRMTNGIMQYAIVKDCGNGVTATPVKPAPTPLPTPIPKPQPTPIIYTCDLLSITSQSNRMVRISAFKYTVSGGPIYKDAVIDWGDNTAQQTVGAAIGQTHRYAKNGGYTIAVAPQFAYNGSIITSVTNSCRASVNFTTTVTSTPTPTPPPTTVIVTNANVNTNNNDTSSNSSSVGSDTPDTSNTTNSTDVASLVNTGPGAVVGLFAATTALAATIHLFVRRKLSRA